MKIIKQGAKYEYKCTQCGEGYIEQRNLAEAQFYTVCHSCNGTFELVNTTEFEYEQEVPDPVSVEPTV